MPTMTKTKRESKAKAADVVTCCLAINHTCYDVSPIAPGEDNVKAFRLVKHSGDGAVYDIAKGHDGICRCDCPDYVCRHEGTLSLCKHLKAAVKVGLLDAPSWTGKPAPEAAPLARVRDEFDPEPAATAEPCCAPHESNPCVGCSADVAAPAVVVATAEECFGATYVKSSPAPCPHCGDVHPAGEGDFHAPGLPAGHADSWEAWTEADTWNPAIPEGGEGKGAAGEDLGPCDPIDDDTPPAPTLAEAVKAEGARFAAMDSELGDWLADLMGDLLDRIRLCKATTVDQFRERDAALMADHERSIYRAGEESGSLYLGSGMPGLN